MDHPVINPVDELRAFFTAALVRPVQNETPESPAAQRRRRLICTLTLVIGGAVLGWSLRIPAGDPRFYLATLSLAAVWVVGSLASGRLHLGHARTRSGRTDARPVVQGFVLGLALLILFVLGAVVVARIPALRGPVVELLDHARFGSLALVTVITMVNGIAEEMFFRGALYAASASRDPLIVSTVLYTLVTAASGIPLLVLAGLLLGVVTALQRRVTGGILGPIVTHLTWSVGMLYLLPSLLH